MPRQILKKQPLLQLFSVGGWGEWGGVGPKWKGGRVKGWWATCLKRLVCVFVCVLPQVLLLPFLFGLEFRLVVPLPRPFLFDCWATGPLFVCLKAPVVLSSFVHRKKNGLAVRLFVFVGVTW